MKRLALGVVGLVLSVTAGVAQAPRPDESLDQALTAFWSANDAGQADGRIDRIVRAGAAFDAVYARVKQGRSYSPQPSGVSQMPTSINGTLLDNTIDVPAGYTPDRKWPLRVQLHGGVGREAPRPGQPTPQGRGGRGGLTTNRIPTDESQIVLQPRAYLDMEWWRGSQVDNVMKLMDAIKRKYNVDENRVSMAGASDGGTGVWFWAMRQATPFANCTILIGHPLVLANPDTGAEQQLYPTNAVNCPVFAVNGGKDPLYPADSVVPFVRMYERAGVDIIHHVHPDAGHTTSWWPEERPLFEQWASTRPRTPHPSKLSWETDRTDRYNREKWLVITALGPRPSDVKLPDVNTVETGAGERPVFERRRQGGRVDVTRTGNAFEARTRGVRQFTLLLSPEVVDFSKPVTVTVNGRQVVSGPVQKSVETLMKWNARDDDRTMLYAAELAVAVP